MSMEDFGKDPLKNKKFKSPGLLDMLREALLGQGRPLNCVQIEVTSRCAGGCVYCPKTTQAAGWKARHMSAEVFAALWPFLRQAKRAHLQGWGEPLLHPRFFDFADFAIKSGCQVSTTSSGLKMDAHIARRIIESGLDMIAFSLVGTDEESNSPRAGISFSRVCDSVTTLSSAVKSAHSPIEIHFAYLMLADRMDSVLKLPELMEKLNVHSAIISTLDYLSVPEHRELAFSSEENEKLARAREILEKTADLASGRGLEITYALPGNKPGIHPDGCRENVAASLYVDAEGAVSPCVYLNVPGTDGRQKRRVFGNVLKNDPSEIWKNPAYRDFRKALLRNEPPDVCLNCPKRMEIVSAE